MTPIPASSVISQLRNHFFDCENQLWFMKNMAQTSGTEGSLVLIPILLLPLLFLILRHFKILSSPFKSPLVPPGPYPWPIIGNILQLGNKPHVTLTQLAKNYGPLISLRLGTKLMVVGSSPDIAKEILKTHDRVLSGRHVPNVFSHEVRTRQFLTWMVS